MSLEQYKLKSLKDKLIAEEEARIEEEKKKEVSRAVDKIANERAKIKKVEKLGKANKAK